MTSTCIAQYPNLRRSRMKLLSLSKNVVRASVVALVLASGAVTVAPAFAGPVVSVEQIQDLADIGLIMIKQDSLASELYRRQGEDAGQFGFKVGMGAAKGNTLP